MTFNPEPVKKWFGYTRKERRASFMLIILIVIVLAARMAVPATSMEITDLTYMINLPGENQVTEPSFAFDPNLASFDTLVKAGLSEGEAKTLINYRSKGGRFRNPSDIKRLYGLDSLKAVKLIPFVRISPDTVKARYNSRYQKRSPVELNSCDSSSLVSLPGIGPVLSARIIRYRNLLGGFASVSQLKEVYGLPAETFRRISSMVYADSTLVNKVNVSTADYTALTRIPYLRRYQVTDIIKYRELQGRISGIDELVRNNIIHDSIAKKIRPYLEFAAP